MTVTLNGRIYRAVLTSNGQLAVITRRESGIVWRIASANMSRAIIAGFIVRAIL